MRAKLATLNQCAVPFLSRAVANLCWYYYILNILTSALCSKSNANFYQCINLKNVKMEFLYPFITLGNGHTDNISLRLGRSEP